MVESLVVARARSERSAQVDDAIDVEVTFDTLSIMVGAICSVVQMFRTWTLLWLDTCMVGRCHPCRCADISHIDGNAYESDMFALSTSPTQNSLSVAGLSNL